MVNNNLLPTTDNFTVHIGEGGNNSRLNKNITAFTLPALANNEIATPYLNRQNFAISEVTSLEPIQVSFVRDEEMSAYEEIFTWMNDNNCPEKNGLIEYKDIIVHVKSSHNNITKQLQYEDCFPTSISSVDFNIQTEGEPVFAVFSVSFRFNAFNFIK